MRAQTVAVVKHSKRCAVVSYCFQPSAVLPCKAQPVAVLERIAHRVICYRLIIKLLYTRLQELHESVNREIISTDRNKEIPVRTEQGVVGLCVDIKPFPDYVGVDPAYVFQGFAFRGCDPVLFVEFGLVVVVQEDHNIMVLHYFLHFRIGPDPLLHLAAVDTAMAGYVHENRLAGSL